jgi:hypothetical protein
MDLTFEIDNNLPADLCQNIIERFEKDGRKMNGHTAGGYNPTFKSSIDLQLSRLPEWEDVYAILNEKMKENMKAYQKFLNGRLPMHYNMMDLWHSGYQIQKSGFYKWHHDERIEFGRERVITFIWYLNTIENGGHTGFLHKSVKPETGKFVFFPATWDYIHCGFEASNKYIVTGWLWRDYD